jgi:hypothetical protein
VEQAAVLNHLRIQQSRLPSNSEDAVLLHLVIGHIGNDRTVQLQPMEAVCMLRHLRIQSKMVLDDMTALEERRIRGGFNGQLENAHRALDADRSCLEDVIRRLWEIVV